MPNKVYEIRALTGLRGILALWVFLLHIMLLLTLGLKLEPFNILGSTFTKIAWSGYIAVDMFFLLSGFIIYHVYGHKMTASSLREKYNFLVARFARIYPVHLAMLLFVMLLVWGLKLPLNGPCFPPLADHNCNSFSIHALISNLTLTQAWDWFPQNTWNPNSWSISSEWFAYLLFILLVPILFRLPNKYANILYCYLCIALMLLITSLSTQATIFYSSFTGLIDASKSAASLEYLKATNNKLALEFGLLRIFFEFIAGCFLYKFYLSVKNVKQGWHLTGFCSMGLLFLFIMTNQNLWGYFALPSIILWLANSKPLSSRFLESGMMQWYGRISYSFYMTHVFFMKLLVGGLTKNQILTPELLNNSLSIIALIAGLFMFCIIIATIFYYIIENPCRTLLGKLAKVEEK